MLVGVFLLGDCILIQNKCHIRLLVAGIWGNGDTGYRGYITYLKSELDAQTRACVVPTRQAYFLKYRTNILIFTPYIISHSKTYHIRY